MAEWDDCYGEKCFQNLHFKKVYRFYSNETGQAMADLVSLYDEEIDDTKPYTLFDPIYTWKQKVVENFTTINILKTSFLRLNAIRIIRSRTR